MKCSELMTRDIKACYPESTVKDAVRLMKKLNCGVMPVADRNNILKGIVTDRDTVLYTVLNDKDPDKTPLSEFMTTDLITCHEEEDIDNAVHKMSKYRIRRIPVVDKDNKLVGLITLGDVAVRTREESETFRAFEKISAAKGI